VEQNKDMQKFLIFILILLFTSIMAFLPHKDIPYAIDSFNANGKHVITFFVLSAYLYFFRMLSLKNIFYFILIFGTYIEIVQGLFTTRDFSFLDLIYDILGYSILYILSRTNILSDKINVIKQ